MVAQAPPPKVSVEQIVQRIFAFRQITHVDQQLLKTALLSAKSLTYQDQIQVNKVLDALQKGLLKVVD